MCIELIKTGAEIRENLSDQDLDFDYNEMAKETQEDYNQLISLYDLPTKVQSAPKSVFLSSLMSNIKITGVFFPFTLEANVNTDTVNYTIPFTMLHEQAHQSGFMAENEANFMAWLAGKNSDNQVILYSTYMSATTYAMNSLYSADSDLYWEAVEYYSDKQLEDISEKSEYWSQYNEKASADAWDEVNDSYLKVNGQTSGIQSYGEVTELILSDFYREE